MARVMATQMVVKLALGLAEALGRVRGLVWGMRMAPGSEMEREAELEVASAIPRAAASATVLGQSMATASAIRSEEASAMG